MMAAFFVWLRRQILLMRARLVETRIETLQHHMALDLAILFVLESEGHHSRVLLLRRQEDLAELAGLQLQRDGIQAKLAHLGRQDRVAVQQTSEAQP